FEIRFVLFENLALSPQILGAHGPWWGDTCESSNLKPPAPRGTRAFKALCIRRGPPACFGQGVAIIVKTGPRPPLHCPSFWISEEVDSHCSLYFVACALRHARFWNEFRSRRAFS